MAGMPIRRARRMLEEYKKQVALRGGEEPMQLGEGGHYAAIEPPPPVRHIKPPRVAVMGSSPPHQPLPPRHHAAPTPSAAVVPLSEADAQLFAKMRSLALEKAFAFLQKDFSDIEHPAVKAKLLLKQQEVAVSLLSLGGRIDSSVFRGNSTDELGQMLEAIKSAPQ